MSTGTFIGSALTPSKTSNTIPLDPSIIQTLEKSALHITQDFNALSTRLSDYITAISASTAQSVGVHRMAVDNLNEEVEKSIEALLALISKCDELAMDLSAIDLLSEQIKHVKDSLAFLDSKYFSSK